MRSLYPFGRWENKGTQRLSDLRRSHVDKGKFQDSQATRPLAPESVLSYPAVCLCGAFSGPDSQPQPRSYLWQIKNHRQSHFQGHPDCSSLHPDPQMRLQPCHSQGWCECLRRAGCPHRLCVCDRVNVSMCVFEGDL